jgi:uncharacterized protein
MTPQERDLITALLARLQQHAGQPQDAEAEALIRQTMAAQPDAPYLLVQTVVIQDIALRNAQDRITDLEQQLAAKPAAAPPTSFLAGVGRGSVPTAGPWHRTATPAPSVPQMAPGSGAGFLRQAAATAASIAGGALLFQGIQSLFGPHFGSGVLADAPARPALSETAGASAKPAADTAFDQSSAGQSAEAAALAGQDQDMLDIDIADAEDFGSDGGDFSA